MFAVDYPGRRAFPSAVWKLCGYGIEEILNRGLADLIHPDDRPRVWPAILELWRGGSDRFQGVFRLRRQDGAWIWVAARYIVSGRTTDGTPRVLLGLDQDVSELKRAEQELRQRLLELDTVRQVAAEVNSSLDLKDTVRLILQHIGRVIPHHKGTVQLLDDGWLKVVGSTGFSNPEAAESLRFPVPEPGSLSTAAIESRLPVICNDVPGRFPLFRHIEGEPVVQSWLGIPLIASGEVVGLLALDSLEPQFYQEDHLGIAQILAGQLAQALQQARLFETVRTMALTDHLTGAGSRHALQLQAPFFVEKARREGKPLCAIMADLDHFKAVNDRLGHPVGDQVLRRTGELVRTCLRGYDLFFRYGGEEFLVILPETQIDDARQVAERIRQVVAAAPAEGALPATTLSLGVSQLVAVSGQGLPELIRGADQALYRAKAHGRNRVEVS